MEKSLVIFNNIKSCSNHQCFSVLYGQILSFDHSNLFVSDKSYSQGPVRTYIYYLSLPVLTNETPYSVVFLTNPSESSNWSRTLSWPCHDQNSLFHHIHPILQHLHWLPVKFRIQFQILLYTFKAIHNIGLPYLSHLLHVTVPPRSLRSSSIHLAMPSTRLSTMGSRAFSRSAPPLELSLSLPPDICNIGSLPLFKPCLKTQNPWHYSQ